jgi:hypothetical protein
MLGCGQAPRNSCERGPGRGVRGPGGAIHHLGGESVRIDRFFLSPSPGRPNRFSSFPQFYSLFSSFLLKIPRRIHNKIHKKI